MDNMYSIEKLVDNVKTYIDSEEQLEKIKYAYEYSKKMHKGQFRQSGEEYIIHPFSVAMILSNYHSDPETIISGLLHDTIEDTEAAYEDIHRIFGEDVANIVNGVTKLKQFKFNESNEEKQIMNFQKMLLSMSKDIRVIIVKLADRLNNVRTLGHMSISHQKKISKETMEIYAPLAHRLGMYTLKAELEDTSFKYLDPQKYQDIAKLIAETKNSRKLNLESMGTNLEYLLMENDFEYSVNGRVKNIYSLFKKMKSRKKEFEEIYDLQALRVVLSSVGECYRAIGCIHAKWVPIPNRFKDYIAMPKPNLYQSLHTTVIANGKIYEIQIRTKEMDQIAEFGVAAHFAYKEGVSGKKFTEVASTKLKWFGELQKFTEDSENDKDVVGLVKDDIFQSNVYVFTPNGDIIDLPAGSTPLDFAFRIHTQIGLKTIGAIVNNKIVPLGYELKTGDFVDIKTSKNSIGPNNNWLNLVKSSNAKSKIKNFLNKLRRDELVFSGKQQFDKEINSRKISIVINNSICKKMFSDRGVKIEEDLYYEIGKGMISSNNAINILIGDGQLSDYSIIEKINKGYSTTNKHSETNIVVEGLENPSVKLAPCCLPILGDDIFGYISKGLGIVVHRKECNNAKGLSEERFIDVHWGDDYTKKYSVDMRIISINRDNILAEIINLITSSKGKITQVTARTNKALEDVITMTLIVMNIEMLNNIITNMQKIPDIICIERICK